MQSEGRYYKNLSKSGNIPNFEVDTTLMLDSSPSNVLKMP